MFFTGFTHIRWSAHPGIQHRIEIPANGAEGPICAIDGVNGGRSLYIKDHLLPKQAHLYTLYTGTCIQTLDILIDYGLF